jgi:uncharacterized hydrophobic protein (TIGR00271 family)
MAPARVTGDRWAARGFVAYNPSMLGPPGWIATFQDRLAGAIGCTPAARREIVAGMLHREPHEAAGYWLQLVVSVGIATLGLALGSSAVVIGAMLIAPLMTPIVLLGMGLAVGSPFLVLRSVVRILASVAVAIAFSALLTRLLPFHAINSEIAARTSPTALDLLTAAFCAMAGVYASMRPTSDVASTAAGTSIGISLVPPLCASGFGLGISAPAVASGAALLFLANFVAIVVVGMVAFMAAGFNQVDTRTLEERVMSGAEDARAIRAITRWLERVFASGSGAWLRALMPFALLAVVYVPLREALDEVAWQIRARAAVQKAVAQLPYRVVQSRVRVERGEVELGLVLLGNGADAEAARVRLDGELRVEAQVVPRLEVSAIPDAAAFAGLEAAMHRPAPPPLPPGPVVQLDDARELVRRAVERRWPKEAAGAALDVLASALPGDPLRLEVLHRGEPLGAAAREAIERALAEDLGRRISLTDLAIPPEVVFDSATTDELALAWRLAPLVDRSRRSARLHICVERPEPTLIAALTRRDAALRAQIDALLADHPRVVVTGGALWRLRFMIDGCPTPPADPPVELEE